MQILNIYMYSNFTRLLFFTILPVFISCTASRELGPFKSDGCSMFPDRSMVDSMDWCDCCFDHDIAYWKGGTRAQRDSADLAFKDCIIQKTGNKKLAEIMYQGVRLGGSAWFPTWYRWGYGWNYIRGYHPLTAAEQQRASLLLEKYFQTQNSGIKDSKRHTCPDNKP